MSGLEIAGLILGAVPVTIAALMQYKIAHEMLRYFNHKSVYIDRLVQALEEQKFCLESEFDIVLRAADVGHSATDAEQLHTILIRSDVAEALDRYLGQGYEPYRKALLRCQTSLEEIVRRIDGLVPGSQSGNLQEVVKANESRGGRYEFKRRIKFSLRKDELEQRITELIKSTDSLRRLRETSASLYDNSTQSSSRTITKFATFLQRIQRHAESLYGAIAQRLAWECHHEHWANFYLEGRSAILLKGALPLNFKLAIQALEAGVTEGNLRHEIGIDVLENDPTKSLSQEPPNQSRVKFNLPEAPKPPDPPKTEVENLCSSLAQARQNSKVLKVFLSPRGDLCSCYVPLVPGGDFTSGDGTYDLVTLEQIIQEKSRESPLKLRWTLVQRMNLSFNLASSLLQLYHTPWLTESWTKQNICFWRLPPSSQANDIILAFEPDRPFIVHKFSGVPAAGQPHKVEARYQLLNLGIILLEIRHQISFEYWVSANGFTLDSSYSTRYTAASRWLLDSSGEVEPSYFDTAARCIECNFQTRSAIPTWEDLDFRKSICELVIKPLWTNCSTDGYVVHIQEGRA